MEICSNNARSFPTEKYRNAIALVFQAFFRKAGKQLCNEPRALHEGPRDRDIRNGDRQTDSRLAAVKSRNISDDGCIRIYGCGLSKRIVDARGANLAQKPAPGPSALINGSAQTVDRVDPPLRALLMLQAVYVQAESRKARIEGAGGMQVLDDRLVVRVKRSPGMIKGMPGG